MRTIQRRYKTMECFEKAVGHTALKPILIQLGIGCNVSLFKTRDDMEANSVKVMVLRKLQESGIDFNKDYFAQDFTSLGKVWDACRDLHYRQSSSAKAMGRTNGRSFYYSMQNLARKLGK